MGTPHQGHCPKVPAKLTVLHSAEQQFCPAFPRWPTGAVCMCARAFDISHRTSEESCCVKFPMPSSSVVTKRSGETK